MQSIVKLGDQGQKGYKGLKGYRGFPGYQGISSYFVFLIFLLVCNVTNKCYYEFNKILGLRGDDGLPGVAIEGLAGNKGYQGMKYNT